MIVVPSARVVLLKWLSSGDVRVNRYEFFLWWRNYDFTSSQPRWATPIPYTVSAVAMLVTRYWRRRSGQCGVKCINSSITFKNQTLSEFAEQSGYTIIISTPCRIQNVTVEKIFTQHIIMITRLRKIVCIYQLYRSMVSNIIWTESSKKKKI